MSARAVTNSRQLSVTDFFGRPQQDEEDVVEPLVEEEEHCKVASVPLHPQLRGLEKYFAK